MENVAREQGEFWWQACSGSMESLLMRASSPNQMHGVNKYIEPYHLTWINYYSEGAISGNDGKFHVTLTFWATFKPNLLSAAWKCIQGVVAWKVKVYSLGGFHMSPYQWKH